MRIEICVPSLKRPRQLGRLINSVCENAPGCELHISVEREPRAWPEIMNELFNQSTADVRIMGGDDLEFLPGCIEEIESAFSDGLDLVCGLNQTNIPAIANCTEFAFMAVGWKFLMERFPWGVFCPDYWHFFSDTELGLYAKELDRFIFLEGAKIIHHHPSHSQDVIDDAHNAARIHKQRDVMIYEQRRKADLLWGRNFERVKP